MTLELRNLIGRIKGYGSCLLCGDYWNWKDGHMIQFSPFYAMFPYCQECNLARSLPEKHAAATVLIANWMSDGCADHNGMPWREVKRLVAKIIDQDHGP